MTSLGDHYHVGIVVADLEAARARLSEQLGVKWGPVVRLDPNSYSDGDGNEIVLPTTFCYSVGQPCLEIIQEQPGTIWQTNAHSNLHHVGFWSDQLVADSSALTAGACPMQFAGRSSTGEIEQFAYHRDVELGIRIEIVDAALREMMSFMFEPDPESI